MIIADPGISLEGRTITEHLPARAGATLRAKNSGENPSHERSYNVHRLMQHLDAPAWRPAFNDAAINPARLFRVSSELVNGRANSRLA
jgi:hypothetical protein